MKRSKPLVRRTPLKPGKGLKRRGRAIPKPTADEQAQQDEQRRKGCAMCELLFGKHRSRDCGDPTVHHLTTGDLHGQLTLGQDKTVGLGAWHHQGVLLRQWPSVDAMRERFGPSFHHHKRAFLDVLHDNLGERSLGALQRYQLEQMT